MCDAHELSTSLVGSVVGGFVGGVTCVVPMYVVETVALSRCAVVLAQLQASASPTRTCEQLP